MKTEGADGISVVEISDALKAGVFRQRSTSLDEFPRARAFGILLS